MRRSSKLSMMLASLLTLVSVTAMADGYVCTDGVCGRIDNGDGYDRGGYDRGDYDRGGYDRGDYDRGGYHRGRDDRGGYGRGRDDRGRDDRGDYGRGDYGRGDYGRGHDDQGRDDRGHGGHGGYDPLERQIAEQFTQLLYQGALGRPADLVGLNDGVQLLLQNPSNGISLLARKIGASQEFAMRVRNLGSDQVIDNLYRVFFGRPVDPSGYATYTNLLRKGDYRKTLQSMVESREFRARHGR